MFKISELCCPCQVYCTHIVAVLFRKKGRYHTEYMYPCGPSSKYHTEHMYPCGPSCKYHTEHMYPCGPSSKYHTFFTQKDDTTLPAQKIFWDSSLSLSEIKWQERSGRRFIVVPNKILKQAIIPGLLYVQVACVSVK